MFLPKLSAPQLVAAASAGIARATTNATATSQQVAATQTALISRRHQSSQQQAAQRMQEDLLAAEASAPKNEPVLDYTQENTPHRRALEKCISELSSATTEVPIIIGGKHYTTDKVRHQRVPFEHEKKLSQFYYASHELISKAIQTSIAGQRQWDLTPIERRSEIFERAADLVGGKYRAKLNAATMLGQAKTIKQAEIDSAAELADFLRFYPHYLRVLQRWQPNSTATERNSLHFRGLEGFVAAISPFNFTAIGGNLVVGPALMGNSVVWKPSDTAVLSNYTIMELLQEAGLPAGVVNFVPSEGLDFGRLITGSSALAGINFTGSLKTFQWLWTEVGLNIQRYASFPRLVGECGGKNFHFIHKSAHMDTVVAQTLRSAFEYSGQKCSACSRLYVPESLWPELRDKLCATLASGKLKLGPATDPTTFLSAVIDRTSFERIKAYLAYANAAPDDEVQLLAGGKADDSQGYYVEPTILQTFNPQNRLMLEEIFGPVLTCYVYKDSELEKTLELVDGNCFALTGAIFAQDEKFIERACKKLRMSAGNFYINDKSTGAVVGQQPFGGARHSGTNDKAGGLYHLLRWTNPQTVKRTLKNMTEL